MEKDGAAGNVKEFIQGNLQAAQNVHYALSTFRKPEKQLIWYSAFDIPDEMLRRVTQRRCKLLHGEVRGGWPHLALS